MLSLTAKKITTIKTEAKAGAKAYSLPPPVPGPDFSLSIIGSKLPAIREADGAMVSYVLQNGAHYKVDFKNNGVVAARAALYIDGNNVGTFQLKPGVDYEPTERPVSVAKKFTFYTVRAVRAAENKVSASAA